MRCAGTGTARASSSSTGRSTGRSRGPRRNAVAPRPFTSAGASRSSPTRSALRGKAVTPSGRSSCSRSSRSSTTRAHRPESTRPGRTATSRTGRAKDMTERIEAQVERFAPGFRELVLARAATGPADFERRNRNIVGGDINGGAHGPRSALLPPGAQARSVSDTSRGSLPLLVVDTARWRRARHVWVLCRAHCVVRRAVGSTA